MSSCSLCGALRTNNKTCPYNKKATAPDPDAHLMDDYQGRMPTGYSLLSKIDYPEDYDNTKSKIFKGSDKLYKFLDKNAEIMESYLIYYDYHTNKAIISFKTNIYDDELSIVVLMKIQEKLLLETSENYVTDLVSKIVDFFEDNPKKDFPLEEIDKKYINFKYCHISIN